ncbi:MAG: hypothetical protein JXB85_08510 [Anaerolineales bacterium]|nr:hypothetical protein [Anaerolineales bacterium]
MSIPQLLRSMCANLSDADLNAIRKARGFSASETASRTSFASFFLTTIGVAENMAALTPEEAITLRLLHETGEVDVPFFERLYPVGERYGTYTQMYRPVFENIKKNLLRRGLVIMAEIKTRADTVLLERWRFSLPPEFAPFLPPLPTIQNSAPGTENENAIRSKLLELVGDGPAMPNTPFPIQVKHGSIFLNERPFSLASFRLWQLDTWQRSLKTFKPDVPASLAPTVAALKLLDTRNWTNPRDLEAAFAIYSYGLKVPSTEKLLNRGWELGFFSRLEINRVPHYRLAPKADQGGSDSPRPAISHWADPASRPGTVKIDLRLIPLHELELLNSLMQLEVNSGALYASPSLIKLGRATPIQRSAPLSLWLAEKVPAHAKAIETVNAKWGKTILHENLLVARVRDLNLRVQLERELGRKLVVLNDHFVAFPQEARSEVEKVLKKTGFVVRTVRPE